jgi:hypothetical protein
MVMILSRAAKPSAPPLRSDHEINSHKVPDTPDSGPTLKLFRLVEQGDRLVYVYDFGDGWTHDITVEKVLAAQPGIGYPRCVSGRRACPPEDVGGPWGYGEFLTAINDPGHAEHEQFLEWVGGGFDPDEFDLDEVNEALEAMAWAPLLASTDPAGAARPR